MKYVEKNSFAINVGFEVKSEHVRLAVSQTNKMLSELPPALFRSIDYKTTSAIIGAVYCDAIASISGGIVNPIEKGHPDIIPPHGATASEEELRNFPEGLEIKCTIGNVKTGVKLRAGESRIQDLTAITWQAHHREVRELMGLIWDFIDDGHSFNYPKITGVFYSSQLIVDDWGQISGTTGRNTKVTGMKSSGKAKMGNGYVLLFDSASHLEKYKKFLKF